MICNWGLALIKAKCFISDTVFLPSYPDFNLRRVLRFQLSSDPLCSFVPIPYGGAALHSRWLMWAQDRSKEQLSHFSTAQVVGICFPHSTFSLKGRVFLPSVNGTQTPGSLSSFLGLKSTLLKCVWSMQKIISFTAQGCPRGSKLELKQEDWQE